MKFLGNLLWFILFGWWMWLAFMLSGIILCVTLIGIPFGIVYFRYAKLAVLPFGKTVTTNYSDRPVINSIWLVLMGAEWAIVDAIVGALLCVTIVGIPFGLQFFKFMKFGALPFGAEVD